MEACSFIKKETLAQVFSYEFRKISKNTFFTEHLWATTVEFIKQYHPLLFKSWTLTHLFMITSISYLHFALNIGHYYLIFSRNNIFFLIPTLIFIIFPKMSMVRHVEWVSQDKIICVILYTKRNFDNMWRNREISCEFSHKHPVTFQVTK